jgi:hypothetical protein
VTKEQFRDLLLKNELRQVDAAWIFGVGLRQVRAWVLGEYPVPQYAELLLKAYDAGLITPKWLAQRIMKKPPA